MDGAGPVDSEDMLLDTYLPPDSSQESLTDRFEDLFANQNEPDDKFTRLAADAANLVDKKNLVASEQQFSQDPSIAGLVNSVRVERPSERSSKVRRDRSFVIAKIESIFENTVDSLLTQEEKIKFAISLRTNKSGRYQNEDADHPKFKASKAREISFPGKTPQEAWQFAVVFRVLELVHTALLNDTIITKRDIYYRDPNLFTKQEIVDRYVDDIARTFGVPRSLLNVRATAKGLVAGNFELHRHDGSIVAGANQKQGFLMPYPTDVSHISMEAANWILVIEKEATFCSIIGSLAGQHLLSRGIVVTAKGYPDIATRSFLRALSTPSSWNMFASPQVYALVDYDPDGIAILSTYKYGSRALAHENSDLIVDDIKWLGLISSRAVADRDVIDDQQSLINLSGRDRRRANQMLGNEVFREAGPEPEWRRELQIMLVLNLKAELQICDSPNDGLSMWLETRLP